MNLNNLNPNQLEDESVSSNSKALTQQLFHKGMFINRQRSNSTSGLTNLTVQTSDSTVELPEKTNQPTQEQEWKQVNYGKRQRSSPEATLRNHKQTKLNYWLATSAATPTSNRFKELETLEHNDNSDKPAPKPARPPPLFIDGVGNIQPLLKMLEESAHGEYEVKVLRDERVKIQSKSAESYSIIYKELKKKNTEFYTYQPKQDRSFRVVLKHLHPSTDKEEIKMALEELEHKVLNIWNIQNRKTKQALPMWNIELKPNDNNKDIYNVKSLLQCRVIFAAPKPIRTIPQCSNCQEYGHTQKFCHRQPRCVKCAGSHHTSECPRKERSDKVKCILCDGNHPANYKGCTVYKELQKLKYPAPYLMKKRTSEYPKGQQGTINNDKSYSSVTKGTRNPVDQTSIKDDNKLNIDNELKGIRETLIALMNQMVLMTKTITDFISKMPIHSMH